LKQKLGAQKYEEYMKRDRRRVKAEGTPGGRGRKVRASVRAVNKIRVPPSPKVGSSTRSQPVICGDGHSELAAEDLSEDLEGLVVQRAVIRQQVLGRGDAVRAPFISETRPCASSTRSVPAAMSQGLRPNSQKKSRRPQATYARSRAADPVRRTPCVAMANW